MRTVETEFSRLTLCDDGILEAHPLRREHPRTGELLSETVEAMKAVADGQPRPVLWDPAGTLPLRPLGWKSVVDGVPGLFAALAIVLDSEEQHLWGHFPRPWTRCSFRFVSSALMKKHAGGYSNSLIPRQPLQVEPSTLADPSVSSGRVPNCSPMQSCWLGYRHCAGGEGLLGPGPEPNQRRWRSARCFLGRLICPGQWRPNSHG